MSDTFVDFRGFRRNSVTGRRVQDQHIEAFETNRLPRKKIVEERTAFSSVPAKTTAVSRRRLTSLPGQR
ncbi:MAG: hypothetical protein J4215_03115 [Candidatus Diapherotrites archaeon]|uniref:Uncharacterized protein n=1 Tax=Candidatus Iainarchaeum sp. TaxID=3101447 RepID=A0A8T4LF76_9ARCH|nr:hypothetical protein [Candidatus Diapherotrites archaeon]